MRKEVSANSEMREQEIDWSRVDSFADLSFKTSTANDLQAVAVENSPSNNNPRELSLEDAALNIPSAYEILEADGINPYILHTDYYNQMDLTQEFSQSPLSEVVHDLSRYVAMAA